MENNEAKKDIYSKLFELKKKEISLKRDTQAFNYKYVTLSQIQDKIGPELEILNLIVTHRIENQKVITRITDIESNTFVESAMDIGEVKSESKKDLYDKAGIKIGESIESNSLDPQGVGSIITYYRRYNLLALLDLETEDDDGAKGSQKAQSNQYKSQEKEENLEKHICTKCGKEVGAKLFQGTYGMCFKCPECGQYSKPNPVKKNNQDEIDLSEIPF